MHILFVLNSDIRQEQRINKEIETLEKAGHRITLLDLPLVSCRQPECNKSYDHKPIILWSRGLPKMLFFWGIKYFESILRFVFLGVRSHPDVIHCVDRLALAPGWLIACIARIPLVYDSQEIWPEVNSILNRPRWLWLFIERYIAIRAARVIVTDIFRKEITVNTLKLDSSKVSVLMNLPLSKLLDTGNRQIRDECGHPEKKLITYIGALSPGRHLEEIIGALCYLPEDYAIICVGFGNIEYITQLHSHARNLAVSGRFVILPPVMWSEVSNYIRSADCSLALYEKNSINNLYSSPSKLFDALTVGLPVIGTDNPLIVEILEELQGGLTINHVSSSSIASAICNLLDQSVVAINRVKLENLARVKYTWGNQEYILVEIYNQL